jgi:hypothetical protein
MLYFNMGNTFSYAELTYLMFLRPIMVERGHHDGVAPDRWVASEFAKTRFLYAQYGLSDRAEIDSSTAVTPSTHRALSNFCIETCSGRSGTSRFWRASIDQQIDARLRSEGGGALNWRTTRNSFGETTSTSTVRCLSPVAGAKIRADQPAAGGVDR